MQVAVVNAWEVECSTEKEVENHSRLTLIKDHGCCTLIKILVNEHPAGDEPSCRLALHKVCHSSTYDCTIQCAL